MNYNNGGPIISYGGKDNKNPRPIKWNHVLFIVIIITIVVMHIFDVLFYKNVEELLKTSMNDKESYSDELTNDEFEDDEKNDEYEKVKEQWEDIEYYYFDYVSDNVVLISNILHGMPKEEIQGNGHFNESKRNLTKKLEAQIEYAKNTPDKIYLFVYENSSLLQIEMNKKDFDIKELSDVMLDRMHSFNTDMFADLYNGVKDYYTKNAKDSMLSSANAMNRYKLSYNEKTQNVEYFISDYYRQTSINLSTNLIDEETIKNESIEFLECLYNYFFAIRGQDFKSRELKEFFMGQIWYCPIYQKGVPFEELNEIEKQNIKIIKEEIERRK